MEIVIYSRTSFEDAQEKGSGKPVAKKSSKPKAAVKSAEKSKRPVAKTPVAKPVAKPVVKNSKAPLPAKQPTAKPSKVESLKKSPPAKVTATKAVATKPAENAKSVKPAVQAASKNGKTKSDSSGTETPKVIARPGVVLLTMNPKAKKAIDEKSPKSEKSKAVSSKKEKAAKKDDSPIRLPPPPVTSDSKMAKNRAGLSSKELEVFRDLLLNKRREILGDVTSMERDALRSGNTNLSTLPLHMADTGTDNYEQEFTLGLVEKDRQLLREIQSALAKIQDGSYGVCEGTGKPISKPRLEAKPWAKYSIEYARQLEKPQFRRIY
ncbi:MAG: TraR/DksA C4-type zinc finger protein [Pirellulales bacterium]